MAPSRLVERLIDMNGYMARSFIALNLRHSAAIARARSMPFIVRNDELEDY
jgi:hypothetical protein